MRLAFIQDHPVNESLPLADLMGACAEAGHFCEGFIEANEYRFAHAVRAFRPEILVVPVDVGARGWAIETIGALRDFLAPGVRAVACGSDPTTNPEGIAGLGVDWAVVGEADIPLLALLERLSDRADPRGLPGVWTRGDDRPPSRAGRAEDLDALPLPLRAIYLKRPRGPLPGTLRTNLTRGTLAEGDERRKSPERFVEEIRHSAKRRPLHALHFTDEAFAEDPVALERFLTAYERYARLPFTCKGPGTSIDKGRIEMLDEAGCRGFVLTIRPSDGLNVLSDLVERMHRIGWFFATTAVVRTADEAERMIEWNRLLGARHTRLRIAPGASDRRLEALAPWFVALSRSDHVGAAAGWARRFTLSARVRRSLVAVDRLGEARLFGVPWPAALGMVRRAGLGPRRTKGTAGYLP